MSVAEKLPGTQLSIAATIAGVVIGGAMFMAGKTQPEKWVSQMSFSHHKGYGRFECAWCHTPAPNKALGFGTTMTCKTMDCHAELDLLDSKPRQQLIDDLAGARLSETQWRSDHAAHHIDLHAAAAKMGDCISCHSEHTNKPAPFPAGFGKFVPKGPDPAETGTAWRSITGREVAVLP